MAYMKTKEVCKLSCSNFNTSRICLVDFNIYKSIWVDWTVLCFFKFADKPQNGYDQSGNPINNNRDKVKKLHIGKMVKTTD